MDWVMSTIFVDHFLSITSTISVSPEVKSFSCETNLPHSQMFDREPPRKGNVTFCDKECNGGLVISTTLRLKEWNSVLFMVKTMNAVLSQQSKTKVESSNESKS